MASRLQVDARTGPSHRALRLSMIHSAQVFSPRPSKDPRENLRILQSPLKNTFKPSTPSQLSRSPSKYPSRNAYDDDSDEEMAEEEDDIILVDGNHPRVVEEDRDLVILEDVELPPSHSPDKQQSQHQQVPLPPKTPSRRVPRASLHRAVLIRSAQRAVLHAEKEREREEEEEREVLGVVADVAESDEEEDVYDDDDDERDDGDVDDDGEDDDDEEEEEEESKEEKKLTWRKSLERMWPFRGSSAVPDEVCVPYIILEDVQTLYYRTPRRLPLNPSSSLTDKTSIIQMILTRTRPNTKKSSTKPPSPNCTPRLPSAPS